MKITLADKFIAYLALLSGLTISAVAIWYSVAGLVSIFAAAVTPIIVMGVALEISKLIATVWLKINWARAPIFIRSYLIAAIAILMIITSMGIFGFLSKAHSDQSLVSGDVQSKIAIYDEKIKTEKENIDANRKVLKQLDEAVDQVMGRSTDEKGAEKAVAIRKAQQKDRGRITQEIAQSQKTISTLNSERAPIAAEVRKVEAEVGPIKYIAAFIYGDNPDANVLEKAVTWVIIIIVSVFDPLAVILLLASQYSFQWFRKDQEEQQAEGDSLTTESGDNIVEEATVTEVPAYEPDDGPLTDDQIRQIKELVTEPIPCNLCGTALENVPGIGLFCPNKECGVIEEPVEDTQLELNFNAPVTFNELSQADIDKLDAGEPLDQWNKMIEAAEREMAKEKTAEEILDEGLAEPKNLIFPENPEKGDRCIMFVDDANRNFIFNGDVWIDADHSDSSAVNALDELKKKSSYIIKDHNQQIKKTKE